MNNNNSDINDVADLFSLASDGEITDEQFETLKTLLRNNKAARHHYFGLVNIAVLLGDFKEGFKEKQEFPSNIDFLYEMAEYEKTAPGILVEKPIEESVYLGLMKVEKPKRTISRLSIYTLILSAAAVLLFMVMVLLSPIRPVVATLTDSINAEWISEEDIPAKWDVLRQGGLTLVKGLAEITFDDGAVVVVEAPAVFELESAKSMFLHSGKVSALVSEYATGFTVNTLSASIVDLGTEFGVSVEGDGSCSLYMFEGKANLIVGQKGQKKKSQTVTEGQARQIKNDGRGIRSIGFNKDTFVRWIPSPYELAVKQSNPVAYWRFESDDSDKCFNSITIDNYEGQLFGDVTKTNGPDLGDLNPNLALKFQDMQSSVRIDNTNRNWFRSRGYTMAAWVILDSTNSESNIISSTPNDVRSDFLARHIHVDANGNARHRPDSEIIIGQTTIQPGNWYHIVVSSTPDGRRNLFVNGIIDCPTGVLGEIGKYAVDLAETITFGATNRGQQKLDGFVGALDEVVIWDRVLNANEVKSLFNSTKKY